MNVSDVTLKEATFDDWQQLLEWRNEYQARVNSLNNELIDEHSHKQWLEKTLNDPSRRIFIGLNENVPVGTVRYKWKDDRYYLSWTVAPSARGKGVGKALVKKLVDYLDNSKVMAEIKKDNLASIKIAEFAGLTFLNKAGGVLYYGN